MRQQSGAKSSSEAGPAGSGNYKVQPGDCISSIAHEHGFFWRTIWDHPNNAQLKSIREDPNVLLAADRVFLPDRQEKVVPGATELRHRFLKKGTPAKLRLLLLEPPEQRGTIELPDYRGTGTGGLVADEPRATEGEREDRPLANVPYLLAVDGRLTEGTTDADGRIEVSIPPNARAARLIIRPGTPNEMELPLHLGRTDPISEIRGVKQRLANLGYECGSRDDAETPGLEATLRRFQTRNGLTVTGRVDDATRQKLRELHGS